MSQTDYERGYKLGFEDGRAQMVFVVEVSGRGRWRMTGRGKIEKFHDGKWWPANLALVHCSALSAFSEECVRRAAA